jgi:protein-S-isoprenylcysteine O-methyltransferase Ste14
LREHDPETLNLGKDWPLVPYLLVTSAGIIVSFFDLWFIQSFSLDVIRIGGFLLAVSGLYLKYLSRSALMGKGLSLHDSVRVKFVKRHELVTDGVYSRIRHPLYLGEIARNFGIVLITMSLRGLIFILLGVFFLLKRIQIEEEALLEQLDGEYSEYINKTKKLIPFIY